MPRLDWAMALVAARAVMANVSAKTFRFMCSSRYRARSVRWEARTPPVTSGCWGRPRHSPLVIGRRSPVLHCGLRPIAASRLAGAAGLRAECAPMTPQRMLVLGATGPTGRHVIEQAVSAGHTVTGFARRPARLALRHPNLTLVEGDVTSAAGALERALAGQDVVI